jgi:hypothetical protein
VSTRGSAPNNNIIWDAILYLIAWVRNSYLLGSPLPFSFPLHLPALSSSILIIASYCRVLNDASIDPNIADKNTPPYLLPLARSPNLEVRRRERGPKGKTSPLGGNACQRSCAIGLDPGTTTSQKQLIPLSTSLFYLFHVQGQEYQ